MCETCCHDKVSAVVTAKTQYNLKNAQEYFEVHLAVGDYYAEGQRVTGEWREWLSQEMERDALDMAQLRRAPTTISAIALASARLAVSFPSLAGTGISQQGPSMSAAMAGAAFWIGASVGIFKSCAVRRMLISSGLGVR